MLEHLPLSGTARRIRRTLEALAADLPKLRNVDVSGVKLAGEALDTKGCSALIAQALQAEERSRS